MMSVTARQVDRHMREVAPFIDWTGTCDTFKAGDPDVELEGIAVSWMSSLANLRGARRRGCNLFITHEPTFYSHMDDDPVFDEDACTKEKRALLAETGMVVYRCHDVWDRFEDVGILDSWAKCLDLTGPVISAETFWRVVAIEPTTVGDLARHVGERTRPFGQPVVPIVGDHGKVVSKVAIGTGAITSAREYHRLGADVGIVTEITWWRDVRWALDMGFPLLVVDHTVSEEPGMINLAKYLARQFDGVRVEYIPTHCPYTITE